MRKKIVFENLNNRKEIAIKLFEDKKFILDNFVRHTIISDVIIQMSLHVYFLYVFFLKNDFYLVLVIYSTILMMSIIIEIINRGAKNLRMILRVSMNFLMTLLSYISLFLTTAYNIFRIFNIINLVNFNTLFDKTQFLALATIIGNVFFYILLMYLFYCSSSFDGFKYKNMTISDANDLWYFSYLVFGSVFVIKSFIDLYILVESTLLTIIILSINIYIIITLFFLYFYIKKHVSLYYFEHTCLIYYMLKLFIFINIFDVLIHEFFIVFLQNDISSVYFLVDKKFYLSSWYLKNK